MENFETPETPPNPPQTFTAEDRTWSSPLRYTILVFVVILSAAILFLLKDNLSLLVISLSISFMLMPLIGFFQKRLHLPRSLAVLISYVLGLALLIILIRLIIPSLIARFSDFLSRDWPAVFNDVDKWLAEIILETEVNKLQIGSETIDLSVPLVEVRRWFNSLAEMKIDLSQLIDEWSTILTSAFSIGRNVFSTLLSFVTAMMVSIHVANDGEKVRARVVGMFKAQYQPEMDELITQLRNVWTEFFGGELKLMLAIGVITTIFCSAIGLRWALLLGIIAGCLEIIPNIGPIVATIPAILSAAVFGSRYLPLNNLLLILITILGYILIQQVENAILVPRIMSEAVGVHPVILILGILVLSGRMGVLGALLAAPLLGMIKVFGEYLFAKLREEDPYPKLYENQPEK